MSRKSGHRFSVKDMRQNQMSRAKSNTEGPDDLALRMIKTAPPARFKIPLRSPNVADGALDLPRAD